MIDLRPIDETARRLREARAYLQLERDLVSRETGVSSAALIQLERGEREATELELRRLSRLYGYPVSFLLGRDEPLDPETVLVLGRWAGELSDEDRGEATRFAHYLLYAGRCES